MDNGGASSRHCQLAKEVLGGNGRIRRADSLAQNLANQADRRDGILGQPP